MATVTEPTLDEILTLDDLLEHLGGIAPSRVLYRPLPGTATESDLIAANERKLSIYELVEGVLVEKGMGKLESFLAGTIFAILREFLLRHNLGILMGADGTFRLSPSSSRVPDVAFISWGRIAGSVMTEEALADSIPDLAVEVLSPSNARAEMARKRREYFEAGVRLVWEVDPQARTVSVYESPETPTVLDALATLDGGAVLPGFALPLAELFAELDRRGE